MLDFTVETKSTTGQVPVVNRQPHIGGDFVAKLPMQDGDALLHPVSFQRDQLEVVSVAPVKQVAGLWFVLHVCIVPDRGLIVKLQIQIVSPANVLAPIRTCCDQL